jgi:hypothetical protein
MQKPVIRRYFPEGIFRIIKSDFGILINIIKESGFEYDLQLRNNYFNLYYKGNSLGKVSYSRADNSYLATIHKKFVTPQIEKRFGPKRAGAYLEFCLSKKKLRSFFCVSNLRSMGQKIKKVNYQEETTFEQMLMTDNIGRSDLIIIDRQVCDNGMRKRMDLLALTRKKNNKYQFCVLEVKLGNNPELKGDVVKQLRGYIQRISDKFADYKKCYELNYRQKQELGLFKNGPGISIVRPVSGIVVVGGYSGMAQDSLNELKKQAPDIRILQLTNRINLSRAR